MHVDRRRYGNKRMSMGPSIVSKETVQEDSCEIFYNRIFTKNNRHEKLWSPHDLSALEKQDPFGIDDYFMLYSLDKKKRWMIPSLIQDEIEDLQDSYLNYRVSASIHTHDRSEIRYNHRDIEVHPTTSYHDVSRDGMTITDRYAKGNRARLERLKDPKGQPPRCVKGKVVRPKFRERWDKPNLNLPVDENETYQKIHVQYFVKLHTENPRLYNKTKIYNYNDRRYEHKNKRRLFDSEDFDVNDDREINSIDIDDDVIFHDTVAENLNEFVLRPRVKRSNRRKDTTNNKKKFVDEVMTKGFYPPSTSHEEESESEDDGHYEEESITVSSHPLHSIIPDLPINIPPLLVFPHTWFIHEKNTEDILGTPMESCLVVKKINDQMYLYSVKKCLECHREYSHSQIIPPSQSVNNSEIGINIPETCNICYEQISVSSENQDTHPFGLQCGHIYCVSCWFNHISYSLTTGKIPVQCMNSDCSVTLSIEASSALLDSSSLIMYHNQLKASLLADNKLIACPQCEKLHFSTSDRSILCSCGISICTICSSINHRPLSCDAFQQYNKYMTSSGLNSLHSLNVHVPYVGELVKCPSCQTLMQRSKGCNHMTCVCGAQFCYVCGKNWGSGHYNCNKQVTTSIVLIDVRSSLSYPLLIPSLLTLSVEARVLLFDRKKELIQRLSKLSPKMRRRVQQAIVKLSFQLELCYLDSRRNRTSYSTARLIEFILHRYFNTLDKNLEEKNRQLLEINESFTINAHCFMKLQ